MQVVAKAGFTVLYTVSIHRAVAVQLGRSILSEKQMPAKCAAYAL